jgi:catechol 2,3-dioxygenase-like lactoylglutathione lyase family enzyme
MPDRHSATRLPVSQAGPIGPRLTAAGNVALLRVPSSKTGRGDAYAAFGREVPTYFIRSRHLAIHVDSYEDLMEYRYRLDASQWPVEMQIQHETIESIYTHDPNGYMVELTRAMRPVTPQEDLDANLSIDALLDVVAEPSPSLAKLLARKAELIVERAAQWELEHTGP